MMFSHRDQSPESEASLFERAAGWKQCTMLKSLDDETLRQLTRQHGVDFATALLFDRFRKSAQHSKFIRRIDSLRESATSSAQKVPAKVVIVPGALYIEKPEMGGDGRVVREVAENLGYQTDLIPTASFGSLTENASIILDWIKERPREPIILVSLSKGGADLKMALSSSDAAGLFGNVIAWINVCGPLNGSRMADWILMSGVRSCFCRIKFFLQKRDFQFVTELCHDRTSLLNSAFHCPFPMRIINLIGFPLSRHMTTRFSRFCHRTLSKWGPNDGTTSLSDISTWPGKVYPVWGADHYFRPESVARELIFALLRYLASCEGVHNQHVEERGATMQPSAANVATVDSRSFTSRFFHQTAT